MALLTGAQRVFYFLTGCAVGHFTATDTFSQLTQRFKSGKQQKTKQDGGWLTPFFSRFGFPVHDVILPFDEFTVCWDPQRRNPRWVLERINKRTLEGDGNRHKTSFFEEPRLEDRFRSHLEDFKKSGFDRGHMAAAANHRGSQTTIQSTFSLANMSPQVGEDFNRGYWRRFEEFIRELCLSGQFQDVYIITGPLYLPMPAGALPLKHAQLQLQEGRLSAAFAPPDPPPGVIITAQPSVGPYQSSSSPAVSASLLTALGSPTGCDWAHLRPSLGSPPRMMDVPTHFFKVLVAARTSTPTSTSTSGISIRDNDDDVSYAVAAFVMPNADIDPRTDLRSFLVPLDALETVAGTTLLGEGVDGRHHPHLNGFSAKDREWIDAETIRLRRPAIAPADGLVGRDTDGRGGSGSNRWLADVVRTTSRANAMTSSSASSWSSVYSHLCAVSCCDLRPDRYANRHGKSKNNNSSKKKE